MYWDDNGDVKVSVERDSWTFNPMCLTSSSGLSREKVLLHVKLFLIIYGKSTICLIRIQCRLCITNRCFLNPV